MTVAAHRFIGNHHRIGFRRRIQTDNVKRGRSQIGILVSIPPDLFDPIRASIRIPFATFHE
ncbi:hypothetical protein D3OALGA1CA_2225 [Olavius algarvensis associated proteobacterium Delta 3]|nr:hypothetical protein D3OALGA1CA_2225 [Olavius algarvensis associated proteobacterium Delta 3]CAB5165952.1 hypothetical protein D3OALGB2SA_5758 [Olavius algarvensis associated proteobacterium Delta 3]